MISTPKKPAWLADMKRYEVSSIGRAVWQLASTLIVYAGLWAAMVWMIRSDVPYAATFSVALLTGLLLVRVFVLFHDTCHGSLFGSLRTNRIVGRGLGVLVFTAFDEFRYSHGVHHATAGDLDRRGVGDIRTMTVDEYQAAPSMTRLGYRLYRHPLVMFILGPVYTFLLANRVPARGKGPRLFWGVIMTDLGIFALATVFSLFFGLGTYLAIQLPVILTAGTVGVWLFYVQHQFDPTYWARHEEWGSIDAALQGSSHYRLPKILQWFTASIGLHHIHHLRPRIPNYNLATCFEAIPEVQLEDPLTIKRSFGSLWMNLWDEANGTLISFRQLRKKLTAV